MILYFAMEYSMLITNVFTIETFDAITLKYIFVNFVTVIEHITRVLFDSKIQIKHFFIKTTINIFYMLYIAFITINHLYALLD